VINKFSSYVITRCDFDQLCFSLWYEYLYGILLMYFSNKLYWLNAQDISRNVRHSVC